MTVGHCGETGQLIGDLDSTRSSDQPSIDGFPRLDGHCALSEKRPYPSYWYKSLSISVGTIESATPIFSLVLTAFSSSCVHGAGKSVDAGKGATKRSEGQKWNQGWKAGKGIAISATPAYKTTAANLCYGGQARDHHQMTDMDTFIRTISLERPSGRCHRNPRPNPMRMDRREKQGPCP
jgi:hypothetical protein